MPLFHLFPFPSDNTFLHSFHFASISLPYYPILNMILLHMSEMWTHLTQHVEKLLHQSSEQVQTRNPHHPSPPTPHPDIGQCNILELLYVLDTWRQLRYLYCSLHIYGHLGVVLMPNGCSPYAPQHFVIMEVVLMPRWHVVLLFHVLFQINPVTQVKMLVAGELVD